MIWAIMAYWNIHSCLESIPPLLFRYSYKIKYLIGEEKGEGEIEWEG